MLSSAPERQRFIMDCLGKAECIRNRELMEQLGVTAMTLWRDLKALEDRGLIRRLRGRVTKASRGWTEPSFHHKADRDYLAKQRIARYAAGQFIRGDANLAIDGGTTVACIADQILPENLTILTNSLFTAERFLRHPTKPAVFASGGLLREASGTFIGKEALSFFSRRRVDRYFLSATGVDREAGITDLTLEDNEVKRAMAASSTEVILLVDQSKFALRSHMEVLPWRRIDHLVTDAEPSLVSKVVPRGSGTVVHHA